MNASARKLAPSVPTEAESRLAGEASRRLAAVRPANDLLKVRLDNGEELTLPSSATRLLFHILSEMANGNAVSLIPIHAELTTQEAADFLNVSRPYLIKLLEARAIPHHKTGSHRRVRFSDLIKYRDQFEANRESALSELAEQAQELGLGY